ncbi:MAG: BrnT family toxin [Nitrospirota bacterium]
MKFEWDHRKNERNIRERGLDFADAAEMFDGPMLVAPDTRRDYDESRQIGMGLVRGRLMVVVFTERNPETIRIISLRKANTREQAKFKKALQDRLGAR